jgi:hypothetical protein
MKAENLTAFQKIYYKKVHKEFHQKLIIVNGTLLIEACFLVYMLQ